MLWLQINKQFISFTFLGLPGFCYGVIDTSKEMPQIEPKMPHFTKLQIYTWEVFPDMAVFDWYIRLSDKDKLTGCDLSYGPENTGNTTILENFLPPYRTFKVYPLLSNTSYWTYLVCRDVEGGWHASDTVNFTTGELGMYEPRLAAVFSISSKRDKTNSGVLTKHNRSVTSPHTIMGISSLVLTMFVFLTTVSMIMIKYRANSKIVSLIAKRKEEELAAEEHFAEYNETFENYSEYDNNGKY